MPEPPPLPPNRRWIVDRLLPRFLEPEFTDAGDMVPTEQPIMLFWTARGDRGSDLLSHVRTEVQGLRPCVRIDLGACGWLEPHELLGRIMFGLAAQVKGYGRLTLPRFALGLVALRVSFEDDNSRHVTEQVLRDLLANRHRLKTTTREVMLKLGRDLAAAGLKPGPAEVSYLAAIDATAAALGRRAHESLLWFRQRHTTSSDPVDALIDLRHTMEADHEAVEAMLCEAFLTDLAAAYDGGRFAGPRTDHPVVLLDHADSGSGLSLLSTLTSVRHKRLVERGGTGRSDPMLVIASGHTRFPSGAIASAPSTAADGGAGAWHERLAAGWADPAHLLLVTELPDLDDESAEAMCRHLESAVTSDDVTVAEHLTGGHPWGFAHVLRTLAAARQADTASGPPLDPRTVLRLADAVDPGATLATVSASRLLGRVGGALHEELVTCSALPALDPVSTAVALAAPPPPGLAEFVRTDLLVAPRTRILHPFLRRVLLDQLAERPINHADSWRAVHERLREHYEQLGDRVGALRHGLALGEIEQVVSHLDLRLAALPADEWLAELRAITAAPHTTGLYPGPRGELRELAEPIDGDPHLVRLVIAHWIRTDPLGDPTGALDVQIATALDHLADRAVFQIDRFYDEAHAFRTRRREPDLNARGAGFWMVDLSS
ncbi:hypothetical protein J2S43_007217 [Catenuloplanes nepalensis]|uniref:ATP-binding protein n=1 Tax=Catenuloplanes nepalensis TaxID=587533 RepID=A0ABT9N575_9ACTN|nr:hypothetical protein [Catenuloplanes nepalensis]MDP9798705.1 hypothetical protein [Catenuloplanes nepalensis]